MADDTLDFSVDDSSYNPGYTDYSSGTMNFDYGDPGFTNFASYNNTPQLDFQSNVPMDGQWGSQSYAPGSMMSNLMSQSNPGVSMPQNPMQQPSNFDMGSIGKTLQDIFNSQGGNSMLKGIGALMEGSQNKKKAQALQNIVSQNRQAIDPFGSQRPFYQQQLQSAVQNPYESPIVKAQVDQIAQMQARKDAAAGRRSNMATSSPAMLAAQAQIAQQYMNSLMGPAGASIQPNSNALLNMLGQAANADVQGYMSPIMSALGNVQQTNSLADMFKNMSTSDRVALQQALSRQGQ